jgi:hypothetical protein
MTITLRQKTSKTTTRACILTSMTMASASLSSFPLPNPEINQETKERNEATLKRAQEIRAERILHPETIPRKVT